KLSIVFYTFAYATHTAALDGRVPLSGIHAQTLKSGRQDNVFARGSANLYEQCVYV
ncbi:unnamed protein product, partial [Ceratitis capitata]